jgi:hypothetical protein
MVKKGEERIYNPTPGHFAKKTELLRELFMTEKSEKLFF